MNGPSRFTLWAEEAFAQLCFWSMVSFVWFLWHAPQPPPPRLANDVHILIQLPPPEHAEVPLTELSPGEYAASHAAERSPQ